MKEVLKSGKIRLYNQQRHLDDLEVQIRLHQSKIDAAKKLDDKKNQISD
jgi:hypothetical protein